MNDWLCDVVLFDVQCAEPREANCEDVMEDALIKLHLHRGYS